MSHLPHDDWTLSSAAYALDGDDRTLLVIGSGDGSVAEAAALVGARVLRTLDWPDVVAWLDAPTAARPVLAVEAERVDVDTLAAALPRIDAYAAALDLRVVVALSEDQIDLVTRYLLGARVELLCAPTLRERVATLSVALQASGGTLTASDSWRESEAARLKRLNQEIARIADLLARLTHDEERPGGDVEDRRQTFDVGPVADPAIDPQELRRTIRARRMRDQFFGESLFEDPAWDMLLDLFAAELEGARVSVSSLCIAAAVASTTALRWISKMTDAGLFARHPDPTDRRRAFMALTPRAREAMRRYFAAVRRADLSIA